MRTAAAAIFAALLCACAGTPEAADVAENAQPRTSWIIGPDGRAIGQARFAEAPGGVLIRLEFSAPALTPGWHGAHLVERGDCSDYAAGFLAAGGVLGANRRQQHGLANERGPEPGDLPNIYAAPSGGFGAELFAPGATLYRERIGNRMPLLDRDGAALIVHASGDDQRSQPDGGAGPRIACAALTPLP